jgi:hypothetical protein
MEKVIWFYQQYCSKHSRLTELLLAVIAVVAVHVGLSYVRHAAEQSSPTITAAPADHHPPAPASIPTSTTVGTTVNNAKTSGNSSPATAGNGNVVSVETTEKQ